MLFPLIGMQQGQAHPYYKPVIQYTTQLLFILHTNEPLSCSQSYIHLLLSLSWTCKCNNFFRHLAEYLIIPISMCWFNTNASNSVFYLPLSFAPTSLYIRVRLARYLSSCHTLTHALPGQPSPFELDQCSPTCYLLSTWGALQQLVHCSSHQLLQQVLRCSSYRPLQQVPRCSPDQLLQQVLRCSSQHLLKQALRCSSHRRLQQVLRCSPHKLLQQLLHCSSRQLLQ